MRETRSSGSVRGASGDGRSYRKRFLDTRLRSAESPVSGCLAAVRAASIGRRLRAESRRLRGHLPASAFDPSRTFTRILNDEP